MQYLVIVEITFTLNNLLLIKYQMKKKEKIKKIKKKVKKSKKTKNKEKKKIKKNQT